MKESTQISAIDFPRCSNGVYMKMNITAQFRAAQAFVDVAPDPFESNAWHQNLNITGFGTLQSKPKHIVRPQ
ncbi:hypothetical protein [Collimonas humicola]|uniref:hypothetical protein n=1 Tax=Collimonas humicola TaxID=2825886 RepID=UPI001B8B4389|nr:hypothetical protein [Collimonas humicola]